MYHEYIILFKTTFSRSHKFTGACHFRENKILLGTAKYCLYPDFGSKCRGRGMLWLHYFYLGLFFLASGMTLFIHTNPFSTKDKQYRNITFIRLSFATQDTCELVSHALHELRKIYREGRLPVQEGWGNLS